MRRNIVIVAGAVFVSTVLGCVQPAPVPSRATAAVVSDILATDDGGRVWHVCETQPRRYQTTDGQVTIERDHYISDGECPKEMIP